MTLALGCIADDYTGASDLANTLTRCGLRTVQTIGVPSDDLKLPEIDAVVVSLKSRSIAAEGAVAKSLAAEAGFKACTTAVMTHGGFGYAREYHVERYLRESLIPRIAPISPQLVLCFIAERVLGLPKSY